MTERMETLSRAELRELRRAEMDARNRAAGYRPSVREELRALKKRLPDERAIIKDARARAHYAKLEAQMVKRLAREAKKAEAALKKANKARALVTGRLAIFPPGLPWAF